MNALISLGMILLWLGFAVTAALGLVLALGWYSK